jgi:NADPH:quinone reductase-like Zn-dependent oxidoreductase
MSMTGNNMRAGGGGPNTQALACVKELLEAGKVVPVVDRCYPLNEVAEAIRYLEQGHARGKVVISV